MPVALPGAEDDDARVLLVCGEALVDLVAEPGGERYAARMGGSPANTAVALGRLGSAVRLLARLSSDTLGVRLREHLRASDVDLGWAVDAAEQTTLAIASTDEQGRAEYGFYVRGTADWQWVPAELPADLGSAPEPVEAVVAGSLALLLPPGGEVLEAFWASADAVRVLDPNVRPALSGGRDAFRERLERWLAAAHLVKASADDLAWVEPGRTPLDTAAAWHRGGAGPIVVLTDGAEGASVLVGGRDVLRVPARPVDVVDTVGAGDSFTGGMLDALSRQGALTPDGLVALDEQGWTAALDAGVLVSSITCGRAGADPPWRHEMGEP